MTSFLAGLLTGATTATAVVMLLDWLRKRWASRSAAITELSDEDRAAIADSFAVHTKAVKHQVATYADVLADGDVLLRERLRQFEKGGC